MNMKKKKSKEDWLFLVKDALENNDKIALTHGYKYKGENLGTFLIEVKRRQRLDLIDIIESYGFRFSEHNKNSNDLLKKYIRELWNDPKPFKGKYITKFNHYIYPNRSKYDKELIEEFNVIWKIKFGDKRIWKKPLSIKKRINIWKKIRYNEEKNPNGKWFTTALKEVKQYYWVFRRKRNVEAMNEIIKYFSKDEVFELEQEGFKLTNPYLDKPKYKRITKKQKKLNK